MKKLIATLSLAPALCLASNNFNILDNTTATISGGSINNTPIGATTPNTGAFTALTATTVNGNTLTTGTGTLTLGAGKVATLSNTLTFAGTDNSTLNIGTGGTLGTAAYTASSAYLAAAGTAANSSQLLSGTWAIPGTIGSSTPNTGAFTTLTASAGTFTGAAGGTSAAFENATAGKARIAFTTGGSAKAGVGLQGGIDGGSGTDLALYSDGTGSGIQFLTNGFGAVFKAEVTSVGAMNALRVSTFRTATLTDGALGLAKMSASGSAPGAGGGKIELVCGTNSGTAKLVAYAGTSGTAVTILDNIGSGVTGC